jgi:hypothetical protein
VRLDGKKYLIVGRYIFNVGESIFISVTKHARDVHTSRPAQVAKMAFSAME